VILQWHFYKFLVLIGHFVVEDINVLVAVICAHFVGFSLSNCVI